MHEFVCVCVCVCEYVCITEREREREREREIDRDREIKKDGESEKATDHKPSDSNARTVFTETCDYSSHFNTTKSLPLALSYVKRDVKICSTRVA